MCWMLSLGPSSLPSRQDIQCNPSHATLMATSWNFHVSSKILYGLDGVPTLACSIGLAPCCLAARGCL